MNAAPCSCRVVMWWTASWRLNASRTSIVSSPGTEKTYSQPSAARHSTSSAAAVRGASVMPASLRAGRSRRPGHRHTDPMTGTLLRLAAFTTDPSGGNPAGVWIGELLPADGEMQRIAAEVGYSETAFIAPDGLGEVGRFRVRYFSPLAEVPFCGHATIAAGVALADRGLAAPPETDGEPSRIVLTTNGGPVAVATALDEGGRIRATLTTVSTWVREPEPGLVDAAMALLGWRDEELDPQLPPAVGFAGAKHLILAARDLTRLERLAYPFEALQAL